MAKAPVMPLFTDALIGDTTHLSTEQFGAYVLILIATWRNNGKALPDDDARMANVCKISVRKWRKNFRKTLAEFFDINGSGWHQHRLEKEWNRVNQALEQKRTVGRAGGRASAQAKGGSVGEATHNQNKNHILDRTESVAEDDDSGADSEEGRCAPLGAIATPCHRNGKSSALKAHIRRQLQAKHARYLQARAGPDEMLAYWCAMQDDDPATGQRMLDAVDSRMRGEGWDDVREYEQGVAA